SNHASPRPFMATLGAMNVFVSSIMSMSTVPVPERTTWIQPSAFAVRFDVLCSNLQWLAGSMVNLTSGNTGCLGTPEPYAADEISTVDVTSATAALARLLE